MFLALVTQQAWAATIMINAADRVTEVIPECLFHNWWHSINPGQNFGEDVFEGASELSEFSETALENTLKVSKKKNSFYVSSLAKIN